MNIVQEQDIMIAIHRQAPDIMSTERSSILSIEASCIALLMAGGKWTNDLVCRGMYLEVRELTIMR